MLLWDRRCFFESLSAGNGMSSKDVVLGHPLLLGGVGPGDIRLASPVPLGAGTGDTWHAAAAASTGGAGVSTSTWGEVGSGILFLACFCPADPGREATCSC